MADLPYPIDKGSTHWVGCYRERRHHNCAVVEVDRLRAENERLRDIATRLLLRVDTFYGPEGTNRIDADLIDQARDVLSSEALEATDA